MSTETILVSETNANEDKTELAPQKVGSSQQGEKQKYRIMKVYADSEADDYRAVVHFENGETATFTDLKKGIIDLERMMDDESIMRFRYDLVIFLKNGQFDSELVTPYAQLNPQNVEDKPETKKPAYVGIEIPADDGDERCVVRFSDGTWRSLRNFEDFNQLCRDLNPVSADRFMTHVNDFQQEGQLQYLLPNSKTQPYPKDVVDEQAEQGRHAKTKELDDRKKDLKERGLRLQVARFSNFGLALAGLSYLIPAGNDEWNYFFSEMSDKEMTIKISVNTSFGKEIASQVINPEDLMGQDLSEEEAELQADREQFFSDCAKYASEFDEDRRQRQSKK